MFGIAPKIDGSWRNPGQSASHVLAMWVRQSGVLAVWLALAGCGQFGEGLKDHPGDCALGVAWADCISGTSAYAAQGTVSAPWTGALQQDNAVKLFDATGQDIAAAHARGQVHGPGRIVDPMLEPKEFSWDLLRSLRFTSLEMSQGDDRCMTAACKIPQTAAQAPIGCCGS